MTLLELFGRDKALLIRARTKLKAKRMNPKANEKEKKMNSYSNKPYDPSANMGGDQEGTGLMS